MAKGKGPTLFWLLSLSSVAILAFWGHPDLVPPYDLCLEVDLLVCWSILLKIEPELEFLKVAGFFLATLIWQKIYERLLFTNIPPLKKTELGRLSRSKSVGGG